MNVKSLRSALIAAACVLSALAVPAANAAFVAPGFEAGTIIGDPLNSNFGTKTTSFIVSGDGSYEIFLSDIGFGTNLEFGALQATISLVDGGLTLIGTLTLDGSEQTTSGVFDLDAGTYSVLLEGETADPVPPFHVARSKWGLEVALVPLPSAVMLLGSALASLFVVGRNRRNGTGNAPAQQA
jgi:hypothetical protein